MSVRIRRLEFDELSPQVQETLRPRVARLGYLGEFFKCAGHQSELLLPFMEMTEALKRALPDRMIELGALTVASLADNQYELHQHEQLSLKLGFGSAWVEAVEQVSPETNETLNSAEKSVQALVIAAFTKYGRNVEAELEAAIDEIGQEAVVAILFLIGRYMTHALIVNSLKLAPPVPSIFEKIPV